jgi:CheY-like chemotaxis protein
MRILLIDDLRDLRILAPRYIGDASYEGRTARNYNDGIRALHDGPWDLLLLDHDLGDYENGVERTGYDIACYIEEHPELLPAKTIVVSSNPVGRQKINQVVEKLYAQKD